MARRQKNSNPRYQATDDKQQPFPTTRKTVEIKPKTPNQKLLSRRLTDDDCHIVVTTGPAGVGKTHLATMHAMQAFTEGHYSKIVICRPLITAGGEEVGFLPGGIREKLHPFLIPIYDVFTQYWSPKTVDDLMRDGRIEICPLAFMRGRSLIDTWVIADEMQNATMEQVLMLLTRLGEGSKMVVTGDSAQRDIKGDTLNSTIRKIRNVPGIAVVNFTKQDVVRHPTVQAILDVWFGAEEAKPHHEVVVMPDRQAANDDMSNLSFMKSQRAA